MSLPRRNLPAWLCSLSGSSHSARSASVSGYKRRAPDSCPPPISAQILAGYSQIVYMAELCRIGIAIGEDLLESFDDLIKRSGYENRSEAFRDMVRNELVEELWKSPDSEVFGTVTL